MIVRKFVEKVWGKIVKIYISEVVETCFLFYKICTCSRAKQRVGTDMSSRNKGYYRRSMYSYPRTLEHALANCYIFNLSDNVISKTVNLLMYLNTLILLLFSFYKSVLSTTKVSNPFKSDAETSPFQLSSKRIGLYCFRPF